MVDGQSYGDGGNSAPLGSRGKWGSRCRSDLRRIDSYFHERSHNQWVN